MLKNRIKNSAEFLKSKGFSSAETALVLGTGLGRLINNLEIENEIGYDQIPHFEQSTVEFHSGRLVTGLLNGKRVIAMQGRLHYYEGYSMEQITFPIRVIKELGIKYLLLSNAAGAVNTSFRKGSLMLIEDHINLLPENPLRGRNDETLGPRFPDMSCPYSGFLNSRLVEIARREKITLNRGVYAAVQGPNLETRAEYRFLKSIGADAVGMSTVPEVIVAAHTGLPCAAVSVITDECDPDNLRPVDISEIIAVAGAAESDLVLLMVNLISEL